MTKNDTLTEEEFASFTPKPTLLHFLEMYRKEHKINKNELNVLDWGCGRGRTVLYLKDLGYNAYGVDIDIKPILNGAGLFKAKGYDENALSLLSKGKTIYPDNYFHFIMSNQVFEHVSDIQSVSVELSRITKKNGAGFHIYPGYRRINEGHLLMPLVHWLPKNTLRKKAIFAYVLAGKEPKWKELNNCTITQKVDAYYAYSINKTFYRRLSDVIKIFEDAGFLVTIETINSPKVSNNKLLKQLVKQGISKDLLNYLLATFARVDLYAKKH